MLGNIYKGDLLDVGGGPGVYVSKFIDKIKSYTLIDISPKMIKVAKQIDIEKMVYDCKVGSIYSMPFEKEHFDIILAIGLFEYLDDPYLALKNINEVAKPGCQILISFPNINSPMRKISTVIYSLFNKPSPFTSKMFSVAEVKDMVSVLGFEIIDIKGYNAQLIPFPLIWKFPKISYILASTLEPLLLKSNSMWGTGFIIKLRKQSA
jgi:ubiquinone/menaquinone biosynthesis C-methylase UbiE